MIFHLPLKQKPNGHAGSLLNEMKLSHEHTIQIFLANVGLPVSLVTATVHGLQSCWQ